MKLEPSMFQLLMGSNQIVHNRGKALAYLGNSDKKRRAEDISGGVANIMTARPKHEYKRKLDLTT